MYSASGIQTGAMVNLLKFTSQVMHASAVLIAFIYLPAQLIEQCFRNVLLLTILSLVPTLSPH